MKARSCFVANSSTASFVLLGFDATPLWNSWKEPWEDLEELEEKHGWSFATLYEEEGGAPKGTKLVCGHYVSYVHSDTGYVKSGVVDLEELQKEVEKLRSELGLDDQEIELWKGTRLV